MELGLWEKEFRGEGQDTESAMAAPMPPSGQI